MSNHLTQEQRLKKAYRNLQYASAAFYAMDKEGRRLAAALDSFFIHYERSKDEQLAAR
jgi:acyl-ACP thioesterase